MSIKLITYVPVSHAEQVRKALGDAGAGIVGKYTHCIFSTTGVGRYIPGEGANPFIGEVGKMEEVVEEKIEAPVENEKLAEVIKALKSAHPYEEPIIEIYQLIDSE